MTAFQSSLINIQDQLKSGRLSVSQIVSQCIANAEATIDLNAYIEIWSEEAMAKAKELDKKIKKGEDLGSLFGLVVSIKDVIAYKDHKVSAASKILEGYESPYSATIVDRLVSADAIIIGRTNCDEFAMGSATSNSIYGETSNALDPDRVPGGSSGGSAVSVSVDSCHVAIGSDTGGSVRQPAAFHHIYGFKPSYGRFSRHGLIAYASSFDQIGLISKDWQTLYKVYEILKGPDDFDSTLVAKDYNIVNQENMDAIRIGYLHEAFNHESLEEEYKNAGLEALTIVDKVDGIDLSNCSCELMDYLVPVYYVLTAAEASSNLSRFDGVRYGYRSDQASSLSDSYVNSRSEGFSEEVKRRILLGTFVLSSGYYDAYYGKAQKMRNHILKNFEYLFQKYDIIALPIAPVKAWLKNSKLSPVDVYLSDIFSVLANILGTAALTIPIRLKSGDDYYDLQLLCKPYNEDVLNRTIELLERNNENEFGLK